MWMSVQIMLPALTLKEAMIVPVILDSLEVDSTAPVNLDF